MSSVLSPTLHGRSADARGRSAEARGCSDGRGRPRKGDRGAGPWVLHEQLAPGSRLTTLQGAHTGALLEPYWSPTGALLEPHWSPNGAPLEPPYWSPT
eukprot:987570-Prorocentrum_minimum.AAC.1